MCGIVGSFNPAGETTSPEIVARMRDRMAHRGPDGVGLWCSADRQCVFGHRRLSIIDLSDAAAQPMSNAAGTVARHVQRRDLQPRRASARSWRRSASTSGRPITPTPRCCCTPTRSGALDCVQRFYGMFAFGIYDARDPGRPVAAPGSRSRRHQAAVLHADRAAASGCSRRRSARCSRIPTSRRRWIAPPSGTT